MTQAFNSLAAVLQCWGCSVLGLSVPCWAGMFLFSWAVPGAGSCSPTVTLSCTAFSASKFALPPPGCTLPGLQGWTNASFTSCSVLSPWKKFFPHGRCCLTETTKGKATLSFWFVHMDLCLGKKLSLQSRKLSRKHFVAPASPVLAYQKIDTDPSPVVFVFMLQMFPVDIEFQFPTCLLWFW